MSKRIDVKNPFYSNDASASAFGWDFQVNSAIFLFLKYFETVESIKVEGKYQDIELKNTDGRMIYAQAKSIQNGSLEHRKEKLEDAIISLAKSPAEKEDFLLYISNYSAPINKEDVFKNKVISLQNVKEEQECFIKQKENIELKLGNVIKDCEDNKKRKAYDELLSRMKNLDVDKFLVSSIYPYMNCEQNEDKYQVISDMINSLLVNTFKIKSNYLLSYVKDILAQWHQTFLCNATIPDKNKEKCMNKEDLLWQIVVIISNIEVDMSTMFDNVLEQGLIDECESLYLKLYIHARFKFINYLTSEWREFQGQNKGCNYTDYIKISWRKYKEEFNEFAKEDEIVQEYLIKKSLYIFLNNNRNINKIIRSK